ncbi:MAG TPA: hypothetical protein V6C96_03720, partial [Vampirovibrionales bacterium]
LQFTYNVNEVGHIPFWKNIAIEQQESITNFLLPKIFGVLDLRLNLNKQHFNGVDNTYYFQYSVSWTGGEKCLDHLPFLTNRANYLEKKSQILLKYLTSFYSEHLTNAIEEVIENKAEIEEQRNIILTLDEANRELNGIVEHLAKRANLIRA